jgi:hypothetical protein
VFGLLKEISFVCEKQEGSKGICCYQKLPLIFEHPVNDSKIDFIDGNLSNNFFEAFSTLKKFVFLPNSQKVLSSHFFIVLLHRKHVEIYPNGK